MKSVAWAIACTAGSLLPSAALADATTPLPDSKTRPDSIVFAGIAWRTPADAAASQLAARGFKENRAARTRERMALEGRLFDLFALVHGRLDDQGRVVGWDIHLPSKGERDEYTIQRKVYDDLVNEMLAKYGRRHQSMEKYKFPYAKGDDNTARGIRQGYVSIYSEWGSKSKDRLQLAISNDMSVVLSYESRWWDKVVAERRHKKAKDL